MLFNTGNQNRRRIHQQTGRLGKTSEHCEVRALLSADAVLAGGEPDVESAKCSEPEEYAESVESTEYQECQPFEDGFSGEVFDLGFIDFENVVPDGEVPGDVMLQITSFSEAGTGVEDPSILPLEDSPPEDGWDPSWSYRNLIAEQSDIASEVDLMFVYGDDDLSVEVYELSEDERLNVADGQPELMWMMSAIGEITPENLELSEPENIDDSTPVELDYEIDVRFEHFSDASELPEYQPVQLADGQPELMWMMSAIGEITPENLELSEPENIDDSTPVELDYEIDVRFEHFSDGSELPEYQPVQLADAQPELMWIVSAAGKDTSDSPVLSEQVGLSQPTNELSQPTNEVEPGNTMVAYPERTQLFSEDPLTPVTPSMRESQTDQPNPGSSNSSATTNTHSLSPTSARRNPAVSGGVSISTHQLQLRPAESGIFQTFENGSLILQSLENDVDTDLNPI